MGWNSWHTNGQRRSTSDPPHHVPRPHSASKRRPSHAETHFWTDVSYGWGGREVPTEDLRSLKDRVDHAVRSDVDAGSHRTTPEVHTATEIRCAAIVVSSNPELTIYLFTSHLRDATERLSSLLNALLTIESCSGAPPPSQSPAVSTASLYRHIKRRGSPIIESD